MDEKSIYATRGKFGGRVVRVDTEAADKMIDAGYAVDAAAADRPQGYKTRDAYDGVTFSTVQGKPAGSVPADAGPDDHQDDEVDNLGDETGNGAPWDQMTRHAQFDEFVENEAIETGDDWPDLTIEGKRAWLAENVESVK